MAERTRGLRRLRRSADDERCGLSQRQSVWSGPEVGWYMTVAVAETYSRCRYVDIIKFARLDGEQRIDDAGDMTSSFDVLTKLAAADCDVVMDTRVGLNVDVTHALPPTIRNSKASLSATGPDESYRLCSTRLGHADAIPYRQILNDST